MEPGHLRFGGGASDTVLHPLVALGLIVLIVVILCSPRKYGISAFLAGVFLIPLGQVVVFSGIHFTVLRILVLAGLIRRFTSKRSLPAGLTVKHLKSIDSLIILWFGITVIATCIQLMEAQALIKELGDFLDAVGGYFVVRFLIQNRDDIRQALKAFAVLTVISGICMINEQVTGRNIFGLLGGAEQYSQVRDGKIRSQAAFEVYIDAGEFGATLVPLFIWLWSKKKDRLFSALGIGGAVTMMITCNSSTPLLAFLAGTSALCVWQFRDWTRVFRWGLSLTLTALHLVMNGPVWSLMARVDLTGSSSGYHRYYLVDNCIRHFSDWWLTGCKDYPSWGWDMWDLSDQYVAVALTGGLAAIVIFILILSRSFGGLGTARRRSKGNRQQEWFLWCLGASLFSHVVGWFGLSFMAQMQILLFSLLTMIGVGISESVSAPVKRRTVASGSVAWGLEESHARAVS